MDEQVVPVDELKRLIRSILESGFTMSLGVQDDGGAWVSDVTYVHDADFNLYWLSRTGTRHSEAVMKNANVSAAITLSNNPSREVIGLQVSGLAEKLEHEPGSGMAQERTMKSNSTSPADPEGSVYPAVSWYKLRPKRIELMHVPLFGFNKKVLEL